MTHAYASVISTSDLSESPYDVAVVAGVACSAVGNQHIHARVCEYDQDAIETTGISQLTDIGKATWTTTAIASAVANCDRAVCYERKTGG